VRASAGDVIMVNPGEMHDGAPLGDTVREWRIIYLDPPRFVAREADEEFTGSTENRASGLRRNPVLARRVTELFRSLIGGPL